MWAVPENPPLQAVTIADEGDNHQQASKTQQVIVSYYSDTSTK